MTADFSLIKSESIKELFIKDIETKIISGHLKPGDHLPPEREMATLMGISRSIVNAGVLELASKGFVRMIPRRGTVVEDYKTEGTPLILASIMNYNEGKLSAQLFDNMMDTRLLIEVESARLAADSRSDQDLEIMEKLVGKARQSENLTIHVECNYDFHHRVIIASGNIVYAMIFKSFEPACKNLIRMYYKSGDYIDKSLTSQKSLINAIDNNNRERAGIIMRDILLEGRNKLIQIAVAKKT